MVLDPPTTSGLVAGYDSTFAPTLTFNAAGGHILRDEGSELNFGLSSVTPHPFFIQGRTSGNAVRQIALNPLGGNVAINTSIASNTLNLGDNAGVGIKFHNYTTNNTYYHTVESGDKVQSNVGGSGYYTWVTGGSEKLRLNNSGNILPGTNNATNIGDGTTNFASIWASTRFRGNDNVKLVLGNGQDLVIRHDGTDNLIESPVGGDLKIMAGTGDTADETCATFAHNGACSFYNDNVLALNTTVDGIKVPASASAQNAHVEVHSSNGGQAKITLKAGGNLNGGVSRASRIDFVNTNTSASSAWTLINNYDQNNDDHFSIRHGADKAIVCIKNGQVELFYDNSRKFSTETTGPHLHGLSAGSGHSDLRYKTSDGRLYYDSSTRLVKTDIIDSPYGIDALKQLKPRKYKRTDIEGTPNEIGFIADEVVSVIPEIVPFGPKSFYTKDESDTEEIPINVDYRRMTAVLTKALQEAVTKIETLEAKVAALESN